MLRMFASHIHTHIHIYTPKKGRRMPIECHSKLDAILESTLIPLIYKIYIASLNKNESDV